MKSIKMIPASKHRVGRILSALLSFCIVAFAQTTAEGIEPIKDALRSRDFGKALQLLGPKLKTFPQSPQLRTLQGLAYSGAGDEKQALASFQEALKSAPDYLPALEGAAKIEYDSQSQEGVPLLQHILRLKPEEQTSHAMLGVLAFKRGDCAQAVLHFEKSEAMLRSQPAAMQQYAACLMEAKETEKATAVLSGVLRSHPEDPNALRGLAAAQIAAGRPQEALETLRPLLSAQDPDAATMRLAAAAYEANKDTPNAVKMLREAIVKEPRNVGLYADFASVAMDHQSFQTGVDMINAGLRLQPEAAVLYLTRGVLYVQLAQYDKAEADFEKAEQLDPRQSISAAADSLLAQEKNQKDPNQALATVRAKLAKKPEDAYLLYLQASILSDKAPAPGSTEFQHALQSAKKAVARDPSICAAHDVLAKLYQQAGQTGLSANESRLALRCDPQDQTALYHLIVALRKSDDKAEIPELLKRLAKVRQDATKEEAEHNRYKLIAEPTSQLR